MPALPWIIGSMGAGWAANEYFTGATKQAALLALVALVAWKVAK